MHSHKHSPHAKLQRRVLIGVLIFAVIAALIAIPLIINDDLRYNLAMRLGQIPGQSVEKLADADDGALLIVLPLDNPEQSDITPWLFQARFIAWQRSDGIDLENIETAERVMLPLSEIEFISANGDGSLVLMRGPDAESGETTAITVEPGSMRLVVLDDHDAIPNAPGDWDTSIWEKQVSWCHRPSPGKQFIACFVPSELAAYAAGDWELGVQYWGDYQQQFPIFRGQGLLPFVGFAHGDTMMYFQNERGLWRAEIPQDVLDEAPNATPYATPLP